MNSIGWIILVLIIVILLFIPVVFTIDNRTDIILIIEYAYVIKIKLNLSNIINKKVKNINLLFNLTNLSNSIRNIINDYPVALKVMHKSKLKYLNVIIFNDVTFITNNLYILFLEQNTLYYLKNYIYQNFKSYNENRIYTSTCYTNQTTYDTLPILFSIKISIKFISLLKILITNKKTFLFKEERRLKSE